jgi:two-component system LytT family response regulator
MAPLDPRFGPERMEASPIVEHDRPLDRLVVRTRREIVVLRIEAIDWIQAADNYVEIHTEGRTHLLREPLRDLECRLDPRRFARIHRGVVVNLDRIERLRTRPGGDPEAVLRGGVVLPVGRSYAALLLSRWEGRDD